jgi:hypothetical protein
LNGVPIVLYAMDGYDFTDAVIKALNANRSSAEAPVTTPIPVATPLRKK